MPNDNKAPKFLNTSIRKLQEQKNLNILVRLFNKMPYMKQSQKQGYKK